MPTPGPGRPRRYCRRSHRQRAYEARRLAGAHRLGPDDVLVDRATWLAIGDRRFRLETAVEDVVTDLTSGDVDPGDALAHLLDAARDLLGVPFEPKAFGSELSDP